jgi:hypothetical protein
VSHATLSWNIFLIKILFIIAGRRRGCRREKNDNKFQLTYPNGSSHYLIKCKFNLASMIILYLIISTIGVTGEFNFDF